MKVGFWVDETRVQTRQDISLSPSPPTYLLHSPFLLPSLLPLPSSPCLTHLHLQTSSPCEHTRGKPPLGSHGKAITQTPWASRTMLFLLCKSLQLWGFVLMTWAGYGGQTQKRESGPMLLHPVLLGMLLSSASENLLLSLTHMHTGSRGIYTPHSEF